MRAGIDGQRAGVKNASRRPTLKDRKGRTLAYDDLAHYGQTLAALAETIRLMSEIDAAIEFQVSGSKSKAVR
jgi:hypothetical protein